MPARLVSHIRGHFVAYVALFVALGGSAYAVTAPKNSVRSKSIKNGQVKSIDLQDGGVQSPDIQDGGVGSAELQNGGVQPADLAPDAIGALGFARISANGNLSRSRGVVGVEHTNGSGTYCIDTSFTPQVATATVDAGPGPVQPTTSVQIPGGPAGVGCGPPFDDIGVLTDDGSVGQNDLGFYILIN